MCINICTTRYTNFVLRYQLDTGASVSIKTQGILRFCKENCLTRNAKNKSGQVLVTQTKGLSKATLAVLAFVLGPVCLTLLRPRLVGVLLLLLGVAGAPEVRPVAPEVLRLAVLELAAELLVHAQVEALAVRLSPVAAASGVVEADLQLAWEWMMDEEEQLTFTCSPI